MPELPEVETVCRGLTPVLQGRRIVRAICHVPRLRWPVAPDFSTRMTGARITSLRRRAKYILITLENGPTALLHLGMSGRVRITTSDQAPPPRQRHDHIELVTEQGDYVVFNDPRRFGAWLFLDTEDHPLLRDIGPEPLSNAFNADGLYAALKGRRSPIKTALLDQHVVAGLGNIYVAEALFRAGISPRRLAANVGAKRCARLVPAIRSVLEEAIEKGGSTLRDHAQVSGELGYFQHHFDVYGRTGEACKKSSCDGQIARIVQSGRSTFFCPRCQN